MFCRNGCEDLIIRENYVITGSLYDEAVSYARKARAFTSNRHDFHPGGLSNKEKKMFEGKLGEKAIKLLFTDNHISFIEDTSSYDERDEFDFLHTAVASGHGCGAQRPLCGLTATPI